MSCAGRASYCDLWRSYPPGEPYWDKEHSPFRARPAPPSPPWQNIRATPVTAAALSAASDPPPAARCRALGLPAWRQVPLRRMHWLHVPKTGSSFGTALVHRGCPRIPPEAAADDGAPIVSLTSRYPRRSRRWCDKGAFLGNLNGHEPVRYPEHLGATVALFRRPGARLLSECAALDVEFRRAFGAAASAPSGGVYAKPFLREFLYSHGYSHAAIAKLASAWDRHLSIPLRACLSLPDVRGCQTKMVLGVPCAAPLQLNASLLAEAVRRLTSDFLFVGLTEEWDTSVCLFHATLGGEAVAAEFLNARPRARAAPNANATRVRRRDRVQLQVQTPADAWDEELHSAAVARFRSDLQLARSSRNNSDELARYLLSSTADLVQSL